MMTNLILERLSERYLADSFVPSSKLGRVAVCQLSKPQQTTFSLVTTAAPVDNYFNSSIHQGTVALYTSMQAGKQHDRKHPLSCIQLCHYWSRAHSCICHSYWGSA